MALLNSIDNDKSKEGILMKIEFFKHNLGEAEKRSVCECLDGIFLTTGQYVKDFEGAFADYLGSKFSVGLNSCTAALHLALLALDIGPGDEVITTPMTFIATANAILHVGARPVFVDVEPDTGLIDHRKIEDAITPNTKAIIPVHLYGQMCDMRSIKEIADRYQIKIVEDCAHCVEGERDGVRPGLLGDAACFSFYATKNLTCGEGGAVTTNDHKLSERIRLLRQHGMSKEAADRYQGDYKHWDMLELGWKYNMSNIQAALLLPQLSRIDERWLSRKELYDLYREALEGIPHIIMPIIYSHSKSALHLFTIFVDMPYRDQLILHFNSAGIGCTVNYRAIHLLKYYRNMFAFKDGNFPNAENIGNMTISLPFWIGMEKVHVDYIRDKLLEFIHQRVAA